MRTTLRASASVLLASLAGLSAAAMQSMQTQALAQEAAKDFAPAPYDRGKRKTKHHDNGGTRAYQRAAMKKRMRAKHRKAARG